MTTPTIDLVWISVSDFKKAVKFYTEVVGLKLLEIHDSEHMGWAELGDSKNGGAMLGISRCSEAAPIAPGGNACITLTVPNIETATADIKKKGAKLVGDMQEVPGHVKMQLFVDEDNNYCQLVQTLYDPQKKHSCSSC